MSIKYSHVSPQPQLEEKGAVDPPPAPPSPPSVSKDAYVVPEEWEESTQTKSCELATTGSLDPPPFEGLRPLLFSAPKKKSPTETLIQYIRICMNKVCPTNIVNQKQQLLEFLRAAESLDSENADKQSAGSVSVALNIIVEISVASKFYADTFVDIVVSLHRDELYATPMWNFICERFNAYLDSFDEISYTDPDEDYDMFCKIQKKNDVRRSETNFFSLLELSTSQPLPLTTGKTAQFILQKVLRFVDEDGMHNEVNELCENLSILLSVLLSPKKPGFSDDTHADFLHQIELLSRMKLGDKPSLSTRAIFAIQRGGDKAPKETK
jgi:hypothetical protein